MKDWVKDQLEKATATVAEWPSGKKAAAGLEPTLNIKESIAVFVMNGYMVTGTHAPCTPTSYKVRIPHLDHFEIYGEKEFIAAATKLASTSVSVDVPGTEG